MNTERETRFPRIIYRLIGQVPEYSSDNIAVTATCLITGCLSVLLLIANLVMGLQDASVLIFILTILIWGLYYLSKYQRKYKLVIAIFSVVSYCTLIANYFVNYGIDGPTILGFFLTFLLLTAIIHRRYHLLIGILHAVIMVGLFVAELKMASLIPQQYASKEVRVIDWSISFVIFLVFTHLIIIFLRNKYIREKQLSEERALAIEEQNKELKKLLAEKDRLFSLVSHDMRAPLASIQGYLELIAENSLDSEDVIIKQDLLNLTKRTSDMLINMLHWSKGQMEGARVHIDTFNICPLVFEKVMFYEPVAKRKDIQIDTTACMSVNVRGDKQMTEAVLRNLISNAIKFTHRKGRVFIEIEKKPPYCYIEVRDTGIGISDQQSNDLFTLKTNATYGTENEKGVGMGLALCKDFIELQNGKIWYESYPGIGTKFTVVLPLN